MSEVIDNIIAFINQPDDSEPASPATPDQPNPAPQQATPAATPAQQTPAATPKVDLSSFTDDKKFKSFSRRCTTIKSYPAIIDGHLFNSEDEMKQYKRDVIAYRREQRQQSNEKKVRETKMNVDKFEDLKSDDEHVIEHEGMLYKVSQPYAIISNGEKKKIPKTSNKDRKRIVEEVKKQKGKEGLVELVKAPDSEFTQTTENLTADSDEDFKTMMFNHLHNDFANDSTFTKSSYLKFMKQLMDENKQLKKQARQQQQQQQHQPQRIMMVSGMNPRLLGH